MSAKSLLIKLANAKKNEAANSTTGLNTAIYNPDGTPYNPGGTSTTNAKDEIDQIYSDLLGREAGEAGTTYWTNEWETVKADALDSGKSMAEAEAAATNSVFMNVSRSSEAFDYVQGESTLATTPYDASAAGIPDWFEFQDYNLHLTEAKPEDWATDLQTSNIENYMDELNYQYGQQQGNTVGQEGAEWWGYQQTQAIQSYLTQGWSFEDAQAKAQADINRDIGLNTSAQNYQKYGTVGYGNPLQIATGVDADGELTFEESYLNLDPATNLNPTGNKVATQYQIDEEGEFVLDDDGNKIAVTNEDGTTVTATPYSWQYVPDATAPGGYRITAVPFDNSVGDSTVGHDYHMANYQLDGPVLPGGGGANPFIIPTGVQNVDVSQFTLAADDPNKLNYAQWAETPVGQLSIAQGDYTAKNKWFVTGPDGKLYNTAAPIDHTTTDSNLG